MTAPLPVLGRGAVSCFGVGVRALLEGVFGGECGVRPLRRFAGLDVLTAVAAELPADVVAAAERTGEPLAAAIATAAAREALAEAGLGAGEVALVLATTKGDLGGVVGPGDGLGSPGRLLQRLAAGLGTGGPSLAVSSACASGLSALAVARRWLGAGRARAVLVVGADVLSAFVLRGFSSLLALDPGPSRPFDVQRRGLSLGEGASAIVLGAPGRAPLGVALAGAGESNDAHGITAPSPDGEGLLRACRSALADAGIGPGECAAAHLHGTGTTHNDAMEAAAMATLFAPGPVPPLTACKAQLGHTLGAAGGLESLVAMEVLRSGVVPGNRGLAEPEAALPFVRGRAPAGPGRVVLKVAAGFGGIDAAVVFSR